MPATLTRAPRPAHGAGSRGLTSGDASVVETLMRRLALQTRHGGPPANRRANHRRMRALRTPFNRPGRKAAERSRQAAASRAREIMRPRPRMSA
jgi:hypothetical protein